MIQSQNATLSANVAPPLLALAVATSVGLMPVPSSAASYSPPIDIERVIHSIVIDKDGTSREVQTTIERVASLLGASDFSETSYSYSTSQETFELLQAHTLTPDRQIIPVGPEAVHHIDENDGDGTAAFSDYKRAVIVFPNVGVDARLVSVTRTNRHTTRYPGKYSFADVFGPHHRVGAAEFRFFYHPEIALRADAKHYQAEDYAPLTAETHPAHQSLEAEARKLGYKFMGYRFTHASPRHREPDEAETGDAGGYLVVSNYASHAEFAKTYYRHAAPKIRITPEIRQTAEAISAGASTEREKARRLYEWLGQNLRYVAVYLGSGGLIPHPTDEIFNNRYGDCKDHVALYEAMLRAVGIESEAVIVNSGRRFFLPAVASTFPFNHAITYIPSLGLYTDPTAKSAPFGVLPFSVADKPVLHARSGEARRTPRYAPQANLQEVRVAMRLDEQGHIQGQSKTLVTGAYEMYSRSLAHERMGVDPDKIARNIFSENREIGEGRLEHPDPMDFSKPYEIRAQFTLESHVDPTGPGAFFIPVGLTPGPFIHRVNDKPIDRREASFICEPESVTEEISLFIPKAFKVTRIPRNARLESGHLRYTSEYALTPAEGGMQLSIRRALMAAPEGHTCSPQDHSLYQALFKTMRQDVRQLVFYE